MGGWMERQAGACVWSWSVERTWTFPCTMGQAESSSTTGTVAALAEADIACARVRVYGGMGRSGQ